MLNDRLGGPLRKIPGICVKCEQEASISQHTGLCARCRDLRTRHARLPLSIDSGDHIRYPDKDTGCKLSPGECKTCIFPNGCHRTEKTRVLPAEPIEPKTTPYWQTSEEWQKRYHIPEICPHCGSYKVGQDGFPDEVYCYACGSTILPWVPLPKGYKLPIMSRQTLLA